MKKVSSVTKSYNERLQNIGTNNIVRNKIDAAT